MGLYGDFVGLNIMKLYSNPLITITGIFPLVVCYSLHCVHSYGGHGTFIAIL